MSRDKYPDSFRRRSRGFALVFALIATTVLFVFFTGLVYLQIGTARAGKYDEDLVRAKIIADLANETAYKLLERGGIDWVEELPFSFSNDPEADDFFRGIPANDAFRRSLSAEELGGVFRVTFMDSSEVSGLEVPDEGSFWVLSAVARVGNRQFSDIASSRYLVKIGVPYVNNLYVSRGKTILDKGSVLNGPIFVNHGDSLENASLDFLCNIALGAPPYTVRTQTSTVEGVIRSQGPVRLVNESWGVPLLGALGERELASGTYAAGQLELLAPPTPAGPYTVDNTSGPGGLRFGSETTIESHVPLGILSTPLDEILDTLKSNSPEHNINITSYPEGVFVLFEGGQAKLYAAKRVEVGRLFDLALLTRDIDFHDRGRMGIINWGQGRFYGDRDGAIEAFLKECEWDDPGFPNAPIPPALRALAQSLMPTSSLPTEGDFMTIHDIEPDLSRPIETVTLSRSNWKVIRLYATELVASSDNMGEVSAGTVDSYAPLVFVQGEVQGKVLLAYDLEGDAAAGDPIDGEVNHANIAVVTDSTTGSSSGVVLADDRIATEPDYGSNVSQDQLMLFSRGRIRPWSKPFHYCSHLIDPDGNLLDLYTPTIGDPTSEDAQRYHTYYPGLDSTIYGIAASRNVHLHHDRITCNGKLAPQNWLFEAGGYSDRAWEHITWGYLRSQFGTRPVDPMLPYSADARIPIEMRAAHASPIVRWKTFGAHSSLGEEEPSFLFGDHIYDYRWRTMDAETLRFELGLPVTPMLIDRRGL